MMTEAMVIKVALGIMVATIVPMEVGLVAVFLKGIICDLRDRLEWKRLDRLVKAEWEAKRKELEEAQR